MRRPYYAFSVFAHVRPATAAFQRPRDERWRHVPGGRYIRAGPATPRLLSLHIMTYLYNNRSMKGRTVLITGGARGMGRVTALALAERGAQLVLVDWEGEAGTRTRDEINHRCQRKAAEFVYCDLSSLQAVRELAARIQQQHPALHVLINNAGITDPVRRLSEEGFEMHLATCHLAHFMLTGLLLDLLKKSAPARILCVSSDAHKATAELDLDDINNEALWQGKAVSNSAAFRAYSRAKLYNVCMAFALSRRLQGSGVTCNAISPGYFINTSIHRQMTGIFKVGSKLVFGIGALLNLNTPEKGARSHIYLASADEVSELSGKYFEHCKEKPVSALAGDPETQQRVWQISEQLTSVCY